MRGQVYRVLAGFYDVNYKGKIYRVRGAGKLRKFNLSPVVGDFVEFQKDQFITNIYERQNVLIRPKVANIDKVVIVTSLVTPEYSSLLLNKMLATIEFNQIVPIIVFTKIDLTKARYKDQYVSNGYEVYEINNYDLKTLEPLKTALSNQLIVFAGQSGVGKSTTIKNLTGLDLKTQAVSKALKRGKHTTRVIEVLEWERGKIIDTPGFSSFQITLTKNEIANSYYDFQTYRFECKFNDCLHHKERECKIKELVFKDKKISLARYKDYLKILKEIENG